MKTNKKNQILLKAREMFATYGINKTTVEDIAKAANVSKATLYSYFSGKEELFIEVVKIESELFTTRLEEAINKETSYHTKIKAFFIKRFDLRKELVNIYRITQESFNDFFPLTEKEAKQFVKKEYEIFREILEKGVEDGVFIIKDISLATTTIINFVKARDYQLIYETENIELDKQIDFLLDILFYGIVRRG